jgi:serine/threonine protein kinase
MPSSTSLTGARIGKYRLLAHIATGGMGSVFKARDEQLARVVALKVLAADLCKNPVLVERFKREARHAARLSHKNIVTVYESDEADGHHYIAMEYIDGVDLSEYIKRKKVIHPEEARRIVIQACKALEHAYSMGITHRDIKPSNFLLANEEGRCRVKLTDLGLARMTNDEEFRVTRAGTTVGTVDYMAPEQARDSTLADVRSDIYSLGCTLYHMLAGQPPFADGGIGERVYKHIAAEPVDVRLFNSQVTASLWTVLRRMLAKHPDDRFQTPTEVIDALRSIRDGKSPALFTEEDSFDGDTGDLQKASPTPVPEPPDPIRSTPPPGPMGPLWAQSRRPAEPGTEPPPPAKKKSKRTTTLEAGKPAEAEATELAGVTPEQRQAAAGQFSHASEVLRSGGDHAYATQLLVSCCKLDPTNILYRKLLREVIREHGAGKKAGWLGSLRSLPARGRMRAAKKAGDHRLVLEYGEELLARLPGDVAIQLEMAQAAEALNLEALAVWLLEEARDGAPEEKSILRPLALLYEEQNRYDLATAQWEQIRKIDPIDVEAADKIKELAVNETLSKSNFRRGAQT